jgi:hypothetical protein
MNFCKTKKCQLMLLSKIFLKPCIYLLFLCLGTILAPSCRPSCQATSSPPPRLGPSGRRHPTPSAALRRPLCRLHRWYRSFTIRVRSRDGVISVSRLKPCMAADATPGSPRHRGRPPSLHPGGPAATKWVSFSDPLVSLPSPLALP